MTAMNRRTPKGPAEPLGGTRKPVARRFRGSNIAWFFGELRLTEFWFARPTLLCGFRVTAAGATRDSVSDNKGRVRSTTAR